MIYHSTRNRELKVSSAQAVLDGIAKDGGLYCPDSFAGLDFDWRSVLSLSTKDMMTKILSVLLPSFDQEEMAALVRQAYEGKFETDELTPTVSVGDDTVLELFRGPTSAFKDVALSMLPVLMTAARDKCGVDDDILILTATSGDTGKAAMEGFRNVPGTRIIVFYPHGGVSPVQQAQMATQEGDNVCVCAVYGNFDDTQTNVKRVFTAVKRDGLLQGKGVRLSSANSINIGRLAPQLVYYFRAYANLVKAGRIQVGDKVDFVVPTGNFGDILAGYFAKEIGLPVGKLVCASNANNILTDLFHTGVYDKNRPFYKTDSPSMDILVSSNLERLLYLLSEDTDLVAGMMRAQSETGTYTLPASMKKKMDSLFYAACCDDEGTRRAIGQVWNKYGYLMDTHTAVAYDVAQRYKAECPDHAPVVILATASPYKFPAAVLDALGKDGDGDEFKAMDLLEAETGVPMPKNLKSLRSRPVRHRDVIGPEDMMQYVLDKAVQKEW